jgi:tetratricopeptide (TPR) repeat protein
MLDHAKHDELFQQGFALVCDNALIGTIDSEDSEDNLNEDALREGMELLAQVVEMKSDNWSAHWAMGKGHQRLGDHENAYQCFKAAQTIARKDPPEPYHDVLRELAWSCLQTDRFDEAIYYTDAARKFMPDDYTLDANHALACLMKKKFDMANQLARQALVKNPADKITQSLVMMIEEVRSGKRPFFKSYRKMVAWESEQSGL